MNTSAKSTGNSDTKVNPGGDLHQAVGGALSQSSYAALRCVEVEIVGDSLILRGRVPTFYLKQVAQTLAGRELTSHRILNRIDVVT